MKLSTRRGLLPPVLALALLEACGAPVGNEDAREAAPPVPPASGDENAPDEPAASDAVVQGTPPGNLPYDSDQAAGEGFAASVVNVWKFMSQRMNQRFVHYHDPGTPGSGAPGSVWLMYSAVDSAGRAIRLEWPYDGRAITYHYDDLSVAPSYVAFAEQGVPAREWRAVAGEVELIPIPNGQVVVALRGLEIVEQLAGGEGSPEPIADGFVIGDVEPVCIEYVVVDGVPVDDVTGQPQPQPERDRDWSSPFCAQFAR